MNLRSNPLFDAIEGASSILLAGAGGGFDIYAGLPLYFALRDMGKKVHLANLSFAALPKSKKDRITPKCAKVTADSDGSETYFPERTLCRWFREKHEIEIAIYAFAPCGVVPLRTAYRHFMERLNLEAVILVDGGTDSLMRGDEAGLGTPSEDIVSIAALNGTNVRTKLLTCIGFGVDFFHGVCHAQFLEAVSDLTQRNAFLGTFSVLPQMQEAQEYLDAVRYSTDKTPARPSIVSTSIAASIEGHFGDHHATSRTQGSELWINPLMPIYWSFLNEAIYERNLYISNLENTQTIQEVVDRISAYRARAETKLWKQIPV